MTGGAWIFICQAFDLYVSGLDRLVGWLVPLALVSYAALALVFSLARRLWRLPEGADAQ